MKSKICTFIGNRRIWGNIDKILTDTVKELIEKENVDTFFVGIEGDFDKAAKRVLFGLKKEYPHIEINIAVAYFPKKDGGAESTVYFDGLENVPPRFAIDKRNRIMIEMADIVITYVAYTYGNSAKYKEIAAKNHKEIIELFSRQKSC